MPTYSINLTARQDNAVQWLVKRYNEDHPDATPLDAQAYLQLRATSLADDAVRTYQARVLELVPKQFADADAATKQQVLALLGLG